MSSVPICFHLVTLTLFVLPSTFQPAYISLVCHWEKGIISHLEIHLCKKSYKYIKYLIDLIIFDMIQIHYVFQRFSYLENMLEIHYVIFG